MGPSSKDDPFEPLEISEWNLISEGNGNTDLPCKLLLNAPNDFRGLDVEDIRQCEDGLERRATLTSFELSDEGAAVAAGITEPE